MPALSVTHTTNPKLHSGPIAFSYSTLWTYHVMADHLWVLGSVVAGKVTVVVLPIEAKFKQNVVHWPKQVGCLMT